MWARRLAALVVAVGLVAGAFAIRSRRGDSSGAAGGTGGTASSTPATRPAGPLRVVCATEFADACATLGAAATVTVEPAGTTLGRLRAADPATVLDVWVTLDPWPQIVSPSAPVFAEPATVVGASALGVAIRAGRDKPLATACATATVTASCLGDKAGAAWSTLGGQANWGTLKPVFDPPTASATGLLAFTAAVVARQGTGSLARVDLENDDAFTTWARHIGEQSHTLNTAQGDALLQAVQQPKYDAVITTQQQWQAVAAGSFTFVAFPPVGARVVAAGVTGVTVPTSITDPLRKALGAAGWTAAAEPSGLPQPAIVAGLQEIWKATS